MQSLAFPMRLKENGLLVRTDRVASVLALLQIMARTPGGSWQACPGFGLRDLLQDHRIRADIPRLAQQRINEALADLGVSGYTVTEVVRELSPGRETDTYSLTLEVNGTAERFHTSFVAEV